MHAHECAHMHTRTHTHTHTHTICILVYCWHNGINIPCCSAANVCIFNMRRPLINISDLWLTWPVFLWCADIPSGAASTEEPCGSLGPHSGAESPRARQQSHAGAPAVWSPRPPPQLCSAGMAVGRREISLSLSCTLSLCLSVSVS